MAQRKAVSQLKVLDGEHLTGRQLQVASLLAAGYTGKEIASILGTTYKTASSYKQRVYEAFGVHSHGEFVARWWSTHLHGKAA